MDSVLELLLLLVVVCAPLLFGHSTRKEQHDRVVRKLGLTTTDGKRFFAAIHASENRSLFRDHFRMDVGAFDALYAQCEPFIPGSVHNQQEVLAVALHWMGTAATCRSQEVLFDLAYSSIHKYRIRGIAAIVQALHTTMTIPTAVPDSFASQHPYFDQALGAIDGTHIRIEVSTDDIARFRNHKGFISTNVLIFCDWHMNIAFAYVGVEGSAHDATILSWSRLMEQIPEHFYVLGDAGYGLSDKVLTPFRGVRYHLKEWARQPGGRPQNAKELFNLRHAKARNVVERTIGILKRRFRVLRTCLDCELMTIKTVISACVLVHNFIRGYDSNDVGDDLVRRRRAAQTSSGETDSTEPIPYDFDSSDDWRAWMAATMWSEYQGFGRFISDGWTYFRKP